MPSLRATPRRTVLFLARTLVAAGTATCLGVAVAVAASLAGWTAARPLLRLPLDEGVDAIGTVALVLTAATLLLLEEPRGRGLTDTSSVVTMLAWAGSALLLGWARLVRDDANR